MKIDDCFERAVAIFYFQNLSKKIYGTPHWYKCTLF